MTQVKAKLISFTVFPETLTGLWQYMNDEAIDIKIATKIAELAKETSPEFGFGVARDHIEMRKKLNKFDYRSTSGSSYS